MCHNIGHSNLSMRNVNICSMIGLNEKSAQSQAYPVHYLLSSYQNYDSKKRCLIAKLRYQINQFTLSYIYEEPILDLRIFLCFKISTAI